jgi:cholesterol transport system auxiliary component
MPPSAIAASSDEPVDWGLRVARPESDDLLGGARIAVLPGEHRFSVYEGARWNLPAPALWRDHLLDAFHHDGRVRKLSSDSETLEADFELGGKLRAFQVEYRDGQPEVVISLDARLVVVRTREILASRRFHVTEPADNEQVPQVVEAFGRAGDRLAGRIIDWTVQEAGRNM